MADKHDQPCSKNKMKISLKRFNLLFLSLLLGTWVSTTISNAILSAIPHPPEILTAYLPLTVLIASILAATAVVFRAKDEFYFSIPFIELSKNKTHERKIIPDVTALTDNRFYELAISGLIDQRIAIPNFMIKALKALKDSLDEGVATKSKYALETIRKLEALPHLELCYPEVELDASLDLEMQIYKYIKTGEDLLLTVDSNKAQLAELEGIRAISFNQLSNSFKPISINRETLSIKIQRYGKEPLQGVGYLEDGTMVVVNGGADYIGETIKAAVLSMKQTSSGRMIFCNAIQEAEEESVNQNGRQPYFALND